jgi:hypothetical protein
MHTFYRVGRINFVDYSIRISLYQYLLNETTA